MHASSKVVSASLRDCKINFMNKIVVDFCRACCLRKTHRLPSASFATLCTTPLELVFSDLGSCL